MLLLQSDPIGSGAPQSFTFRRLDALIRPQLKLYVELHVVEKVALIPLDFYSPRTAFNGANKVGGRRRRGNGNIRARPLRSESEP